MPFRPLAEMMPSSAISPRRGRRHDRDVRFGSEADIARRPRNVRFTPNSGHPSAQSKCPLWAMCGRLRVGKVFLHERSIGRCSHVFGL